MSIANEIQRIQGAKANIKAAIEQKGVTVGDGTIDTYAAKISEISGGGGIEFTRYMTNTPIIPRGYIEQKEVVINLDRVTSLYNLFNTQNIENTTVEHITVNCPNQVTNVQNVFFANTPNDTVLKHITFNVDMSQANATLNMFRGCAALETIDGQPLDFSSTKSTNIFNACDSIKEFRVAPNTIKLSCAWGSLKNFSTNTIQSIIDGLADLSEYYLIGAEIAVNVFEYTDSETPLNNVTSVRINPNKTMSDGAPVYSVTSNGYVLDAYKKAGTQQTLTLHADVKAKLTNEQIETIQAKNWELA